MRSRWLVAGAAALAVAGGTGAALAGTGSDATPRAPSPAASAGAAVKPAVTARVLTTSRRNALRAGLVRVRVRSRSAVVLRLFAAARRAGGGRSYTATRRRLVRLRGAVPARCG